VFSRNLAGRLLALSSGAFIRSAAMSLSLTTGFAEESMSSLVSVAWSGAGTMVSSGSVEVMSMYKALRYSAWLSLCLSCVESIVDTESGILQTSEGICFEIFPGIYRFYCDSTDVFSTAPCTNYTNRFGGTQRTVPKFNFHSGTLYDRVVVLIKCG
jgi:hypothetical protein